MDALSRIPGEEYHELESPAVKALLKASQEADWTDFNENPMEIVCKSSQLVSEKMTTEQWKGEQAEDKVIHKMIKAITLGADTHAFTSEQAKQMYRFRSKFVMRHGLLHKKYYNIILKEERMQFVLPKKYWHKALEACHDNVGHLGIERMLFLLHDRFYWPNIAQDVEIIVKSCPKCLRFKRLPERANLNPIEATRPMELVHKDYLIIEAPKNSKSLKDVNILIVTDHFTRYSDFLCTMVSLKRFYLIRKETLKASY